MKKWVIWSIVGWGSWLHAQLVEPAAVTARAGAYPAHPIAWNASVHPASNAFGSRKQLHLSWGIPYRIANYRMGAVAFFTRIGSGSLGGVVEYERPHPEMQAWMASIGYGHLLGSSASIGAAFHYLRIDRMFYPPVAYLLGTLSLGGRWGAWRGAVSIFNVAGVFQQRSNLEVPSVFRLSGQWHINHDQGAIYMDIRHIWQKGVALSMGFRMQIAPRLWGLGGIGVGPWRAGLGIEFKTPTFTLCLAAGYHRVLGWWPSVEVGMHW